MVRLAFVIWAGFGLSSVLLLYMSLRIRARKFRPNRWLGVATELTRRNGDVWERAHLAALPWLHRTAILTAVASALSGVGLLCTAWLAPSSFVGEWFTIAAAVIGGIAVAVYTLGAEGAARKEM